MFLRGADGSADPVGYRDPDRVLADAGRRIAELRSNLGMTQEELAGRIGVSVRHLQRIEAGQKNLSVLFLAELSPLLEAEPAEFLAPPTTPKPRPGRPKRSPG